MESMTTICPSHGDYADPTGAVVNACPQCAEEVKNLKSQFYAEWQTYWHWKRCGLPARYKSKTIENWIPKNEEQESAHKVVEAYAGNINARVKNGQGLTLLGPPGIGKTHLLAALVTGAHAAGVRAKYCLWHDLVMSLRQQFSSADKKAQSTAMNGATQCPLLALDEIAQGLGTDWEHRQLFALIDHRYREGLPLIISTNATAKDLPQLVGERIADRLAEVNAPISIPGSSQRRTLSQNEGSLALQAPPESIEVTYHAYGKLKTETVYQPIDSKFPVR